MPSRRLLTPTYHPLSPPHHHLTPLHRPLTHPYHSLPPPHRYLTLRRRLFMSLCHLLMHPVALQRAPSSLNHSPLPLTASRSAFNIFSSPLNASLSPSPNSIYSFVSPFLPLCLSLAPPHLPLTSIQHHFMLLHGPLATVTIQLFPNLLLAPPHRSLAPSPTCLALSTL